VLEQSEEEIKEYTTDATEYEQSEYDKEQERSKQEREATGMNDDINLDI